MGRGCSSAGASSSRHWLMDSTHRSWHGRSAWPGLLTKRPKHYAIAPMRACGGRQPFWRPGRIRSWLRSMAEAFAAPAPDDLEWLSTLVRRSPLLPDASLRSHWLNVLPWLKPAARYALAALLLEIERGCAT
jgi:hypothetical protein